MQIKVNRVMFVAVNFKSIVGLANLLNSMYDMWAQNKGKRLKRKNRKKNNWNKIAKNNWACAKFICSFVSADRDSERWCFRKLLPSHANHAMLNNNCTCRNFNNSCFFFLFCFTKLSFYSCLSVLIIFRLFFNSKIVRNLHTKHERQKCWVSLVNKWKDKRKWPNVNFNFILSTVQSESAKAQNSKFN